MNIAETETEDKLSEAGAARVAKIDAEKMLAAATRELTESAVASKSRTQQQRVSPTGGEARAGRENTQRGGIAALNPFRYGAKGIAIFSAAVLLLLGGITALTIWLVAGHTPNATYMIELLADTEVDMDGVTAFGIVKGTDTVKTSAVYDDKSEKRAEKKFATTLVSFDENGDISEVVFRYIDGSGKVTQDQIGSAERIYVTTEFTYIQYSTADDPYRGVDFGGGPASKQFRCNDYSQSFAIHNESGKVYSLNQVGTEFVQKTYGDGYEYDYTHFNVFDGAVKAEVQYHYKNAYNNVIVYYKLNIDDEFNLIAEDIMPNKSYQIKNIFRDVYGNLFVYNELSADVGLNETHGNVFYYAKTSYKPITYLYGSDGKVYSLESEDENFRLKVFDEYLRLTELTELPQISLFSMDLEYKDVRINGINKLYFIKNDYLFRADSSIAVYNITDDGKVTGLFQEQNAEYGVIETCYILNGELTAITNKNDRKQFVHFNFSVYDETNRNIIVTEICDATSVEAPYELMIKSIIIVKTEFYGTQKYQITIENGEIKQTLLSDEKYGGQIISIQPLN